MQYLWLMTETWLVNFHNHSIPPNCGFPSWSSLLQHTSLSHWYTLIAVKKDTWLCWLALPTGSSSSQKKQQHKPLLQSEMWFGKETPIFYRFALSCTEDTSTLSHQTSLSSELPSLELGQHTYTCTWAYM